MFQNSNLFEKFGREYKKGEILFCEYEKGDKLYFVISGKVKISKITPKREKVLAYLGEEEFVGEMAIFGDKKRTATVIAQENTKVLVFTEHNFFQLIETAPNIIVKLIKSLSERKIKTLAQMNYLLEKDLGKKLLEYIYIQFRRHSQTVFEIDEVSSLLNIDKDDIIGIMMPYNKKGYIKFTKNELILKEQGWLERKFL
ncbi:MAG: Crp/Fnr family transcriptional regulator [Fusobacteriota bacterium]